MEFQILTRLLNQIPLQSTFSERRDSYNALLSRETETLIYLNHQEVLRYNDNKKRVLEKWLAKSDIKDEERLLIQTYMNPPIEATPSVEDIVARQVKDTPIRFNIGGNEFIVNPVVDISLSGYYAFARVANGGFSEGRQEKLPGNHRFSSPCGKNENLGIACGLRFSGIVWIRAFYNRRTWCRGGSQVCELLKSRENDPKRKT